MAAAERDRIQKLRIQGLHNTHAEVGGSSKVQSDDKARGEKKSTPEGVLVLHFVSNQHQSTQQLSWGEE